MSAEEEPGSEKVTYYEGKLLWINGQLYAITKVGEKNDNSNLVPLDVKKVEW
jgi:hypothetical protein